MWTEAHRGRHDARLKEIVWLNAVAQVARWLERVDPPRSGRATPYGAVVIRVLLIILLWPVADLMRMMAVTLACLIILMRPFIQFSYVASFVAFCAMWYKIIGGHFQPAGAFAFWSVALGAIPAIWDVILGFIAPDMDLNTVNG